MRRIERQHAITLPAGVERVLPMFTPLGETLWVEGWRPEFVYPASGHIEQGMVFRTGEGDEATFWLCAEWAPEQGRARYVRVTPASRVAEVAVACSALGEGRTRAVVSYTITAIAEAGERYLETFDEAAYVAMIEGWKDAITRCLDNLGERTVPH